MPAKGFRYPHAERLERKTKRAANGCLEWTGMTNRGYGVFKIDGKREKAHRVAWRIAHGEIPEGLCVLHRCDNPTCVEPLHLFLGTKGINNTDRKPKGRSRNQWTTKTPRENA